MVKKSICILASVLLVCSSVSQCVKAEGIENENILVVESQVDAVATQELEEAQPVTETANTESASTEQEKSEDTQSEQPQKEETQPEPTPSEENKSDETTPEELTQPESTEEELKDVQPEALEEEPLTIEIEEELEITTLIEETLNFASPAVIGWGDIETYFKQWKSDGTYTNDCKNYIQSTYSGNIPDGIWVYLPVTSFTYNGMDIKFSGTIENYSVKAGAENQTQYYIDGNAVYVFSGNELLKEGQDYTLAYANNKNVPQNTDDEPTIYIKGKGDYCGTIEKKFEIQPKQIGYCSITPIDKFNEKYDSDNKLVAQYSRIAVYDYAGYDKVTLKEDRDYNYRYEETSSDAYKKAGDWKITIYGEGNYTGKTQVNQYIFGGANLSTATLTIKTKSYTADNTEKKPEVVVKLGKKLLTKNSDYIVHYNNNIYPSKAAEIVIEGVGEYSGYKYGYFTIKPVAMNGWKITSNLHNTEYKPSESEAGTLTVTREGGIAANYGTDYSFKVDGKNTDGRLVVTPGTHTVVVTAGANTKNAGKTKTYKYVIKKYNLTNHAKLGHVTVSTGTIEHAKGGAKFVPNITVTDGASSITIENDKFSYAYASNKKVGTGKVTAKAKTQSYYAGQVSGTFTITTKNISLATATVNDKVYKNAKKNYVNKLVIKDTDGKTLASGTDYMPLKVGDTVNGYFYTNGNPVQASDIVPVGTTIIAKTTGKGNYGGTISTEYRITQASIVNATAKVNTIVYSKNATSISADEIKYVKVGKTELVYGTDYTIVPGSLVQNTKNKTGSIIIKGMGNYGGTKKISFKLDKKSIT